MNVTACWVLSSLSLAVWTSRIHTVMYIRIFSLEESKEDCLPKKAWRLLSARIGYYSHRVSGNTPIECIERVLNVTTCSVSSYLSLAAWTSRIHTGLCRPRHEQQRPNLAIAWCMPIWRDYRQKTHCSLPIHMKKKTLTWATPSPFLQRLATRWHSWLGFISKCFCSKLAVRNTKRQQHTVLLLDGTCL